MVGAHCNWYFHIEGVGLRPLACWNCGFESRPERRFSCECCVLSGRGLCDGPITRPESLPSVVCLNVIVKPRQ